MALLHACGVTFGTILSKIGQYTSFWKQTIYGVVMKQYKIFFLKYKIDKTGQYMVLLHAFKMWKLVRKMVHEMPYWRYTNVITGQYNMFFLK